MDDHFLTTLSCKDLNRRQIKNVRTAHAVTVSSNEEIAPKPIQSHLRILDEFEKDVEENSAADVDGLGGNDMLGYSREAKRRRAR
jgi:hypothetical protein